MHLISSVVTVNPAIEFISSSFHLSLEHNIYPFGPTSKFCMYQISRLCGSEMHPVALLVICNTSL